VEPRLTQAAIEVARVRSSSGRRNVWWLPTVLFGLAAILECVSRGEFRWVLVGLFTFNAAFSLRNFLLVPRWRRNATRALQINLVGPDGLSESDRA
jgi:hypothetical protein